MVVLRDTPKAFVEVDELALEVRVEFLGEVALVSDLSHLLVLSADCVPMALVLHAEVPVLHQVVGPEWLPVYLGVDGSPTSLNHGLGGNVNFVDVLHLPRDLGPFGLTHGAHELEEDLVELRYGSKRLPFRYRWDCVWAFMNKIICPAFEIGCLY